MFIGHFGVGLAAKKAAPSVSLGTFSLAVQFVDLLWPVFLLLGLERVCIQPGDTVVTPLDFVRYPFTHSLVTGTGWALLFALAYLAVKRNRRAAVILGLGVISHWVLDWIVHRPDLPLYPGGPKVGLGLWNSVAGAVAVEGGIFGLGLALYVMTTRARDRVGHWALWSLVSLLVAVYFANLLGGPPPSATAVAWAALAVWLLVPSGYWIDRHWVPRSRP
jgi:hypothetical protein